MKNSVFSYFFVLVLFLGLVGCGSLASPKRPVEIGEVAWAGTSASWADEWIELRNISEEEVDLSGWVLSWDDVKIHFGEEKESTVKINNTLLEPGATLLLERSDDKAVASVKAGLIYKGALANDGEKLVLKNSKGEEVHVVDGSDGWMKGASSDGDPAYASMELTENGWKTRKTESSAEDAEGNPIHGTPGRFPEEE